MDLKIFEDVFTCSICLEHFNEDSRSPKILSCGHTFCHSCVEKMLIKSPFCPTCNAQIQPQQAGLIPVNFAVRGMITIVQNINPVVLQNDSLLVQSPSPMSTKLKSQGVCDEHSNNKEMRCMDCDSWICGICSSLNHKHCRTILVEEAYRELKVQLSHKIENELETKRWTSDEITEALENLEEERKNLIEEIKRKESDLVECEEMINKYQFIKYEDAKFCENMKKIDIAGKNLANDIELSKAINEFDELKTVGEKLVIQFEELNLRNQSLIPKTIGGLRELCEKQPVLVMENENLYGKVTVLQGQIWISRFQLLKPNRKLFRFKIFLARYYGSTELPQKVFLKLTPSNGGSEVDIIIETDRESQGAKNLINHCTSLNGQIYKSLLFKSNVDGSCFHFSTELPPPPPPSTQKVYAERMRLVSDSESDLDLEHYQKAGFVADLNEAGFSIALNDYANTSHPKIGVVVSGLQELKQLKRQNLIIKDCGLVI